MTPRAVATLLAALVLAGTAPAGGLDRALLSRAGQILEQLDAAGHKTLGVLPFRIQKGASPASRDAGPLAASIAGRLENALIVIQGNEKRAVRVLRGAGSAAKPFAVTHEPAWGGAKEKADALLTGEISLAGDRRSATVTVELLEPKKPARKITAIKVDADLALLRDLGHAVSLPRLSRDADALAAARAQILADEKGTSAAGRSPDDVAGMRLEVLYDGAAQKLTLTKHGVWQAPAPRAGQRMTFGLTRLADGEERLGALLRVDGRSSFAEQDEEPAYCQKWVFDARKKGKRDEIAGVYTKGEGAKLSVRPYTVPAGHAAWIDLDVFGRGAALDEGPKSRMTTRSATAAKARTLKELQARLARANHLKLVNFTARGPGLRLCDVEPANVAPNPGTEPALHLHLGGVSVRIPAAE